MKKGNWGREGGAAAKFSKGKARGRKDERTGREQARNACLFLLPEAGARGPAVKHLAREMPLAWSRALFCDVFIKKANNSLYFKFANNKTKIRAPALGVGGDLSM